MKKEDKPVHKPSAKHALDEVLKTLQDLVHNELSESNLQETIAPKRHSQKKPRAPANLDDPSPQPSGDTSILPPPLEASNAPSEATPPLVPNPQTEEQSLNTDATSENGKNAPLPTSTALPTSTPETQTLPPQTPTTEPKSGEIKPVAKMPPMQTVIDWDAIPGGDIPVLNDVIITPAHHAKKQAKAPKSTPPDIELAHEIAVQTIAKLNIELRKAGSPPLETSIINRLEHWLRTTLMEKMQAQAKEKL